MVVGGEAGSRDFAETQIKESREGGLETSEEQIGKRNQRAKETPKEQIGKQKTEQRRLQREQKSESKGDVNGANWQRARNRANMGVGVGQQSRLIKKEG